MGLAFKLFLMEKRRREDGGRHETQHRHSTNHSSHRRHRHRNIRGMQVRLNPGLLGTVNTVTAELPVGAHVYATRLLPAAATESESHPTVQLAPRDRSPLFWHVSVTTRVSEIPVRMFEGS